MSEWSLGRCPICKRTSYQESGCSFECGHCGYGEEDEDEEWEWEIGKRRRRNREEEQDEEIQN